MAGGFIPQSFIDDLLARVDIVDVVSSRMDLKKAGREFQACCPFHDERTASFTVSPQKQFYHCFGCSAHGNAIRFVMEYDRLEFPDAVEELAQSINMPVVREASSGHSAPKDDLQPLYDVMSRANHFYQAQLRQSDQAKQYLQARGLDGSTAKTFGIGFAPPGWDNLLNALGGDSKSRSAMAKAGLLSENDRGGSYDKFRHRIMFPIRDSRGRVIAFGGRVLSNEDNPKYLNSPETPLFHKGQQLYGLYELRQQISKPERIIVVEGYMDVVALAQAGIPESVATLGTATTPDHVEILFRATDHIVFCFDGDRAGRQAAVRAMESALTKMRDGRRASFLFLPDGEDPDTLVNDQGAEAFRNLVANATGFAEQFFAYHQENIDTSSIEGRAALVAACKPKIQSLPDSALRDLMAQRLEKLSRLPMKLPVHEPPTKRPTKQSAGKPSLVRTAINALVNDPKVAQDTPNIEFLPQSDLHGAKLLTEIIEICRNCPTLNTGSLLEHFRERREYEHLANLASASPLVLGQGLNSEYIAAIKTLERQAIQRQYTVLNEKQATTRLSEAEKQTLRRLLQLKNQL